MSEVAEWDTPPPVIEPTVVVRGRCPACDSQSLFVGAGGYVTCGWLECPEPDAPAKLLANSGLLAVTEDALRERNERLGRIERIARGDRDV